MIDSYAQIVMLADRLNRFRSLDDEELDWVEAAQRRGAVKADTSRNHTGQKRFWNGDAEKLERMLRNGQSLSQIARELSRSPNAVQCKMAKMGLRMAGAE